MMFRLLLLTPLLLSSVLSTSPPFWLPEAAVANDIPDRRAVQNTDLIFTDGGSSNFAKARDLVNEARDRWIIYARARFQNVHRNKYVLQSHDVAIDTPGTLDNPHSAVPSSFALTPEVVRAAAFLTEQTSANQSIGPPIQQKRTSRFWMEDIDHLGTQPYGNDKSYQVFRNVVKDFGADPTGVKDSTDAINNAISAGKRCGEKCYSSSTKNAIVYFPAGKYLVSSTIVLLYGTQLIGDAGDRPRIVATPDFIGLGVGVISVDVYVGGGLGADGRDLEYYLNTANFYRQIRNFVIDISQIDMPKDETAALHYQVSQATSLSNVLFICSTAPDTQQKAIFAENGSGGFMSDLNFEGGRYGIYGGNQQFTAHRLTFVNVKIAISLIWDWGWTWKNIYVFGSETGFNLSSEHSSTPQTGSVLIQDSIFENTPTAILGHAPSSRPDVSSTSITLDNVVFKSVKRAIVDLAGKVWLDGSIGSVDTYVLGAMYDGPQREYTFGRHVASPRAKGMTGPKQNGLPKPIFFERAREQYINEPVSSFVSVKKYGAKGDGVTDDTAALQSIINQNAKNSQITYVNAGSYVIKDTITVPSGARIVGELWAQLVASGPKFGDDTKPRPMLQVGRKGEKGSVEMQDLLFTATGPTKGLIGVEWNLEASKPGSAALWDCHMRLGGAAGTQLTSKECPPSRTGTNTGCIAGSLMFHITSEASAYIENMWLWVADHDLDDANLNDANNTLPQLSVYVARGMLIESRRPTWLYGTASEHSTLYQYSFYRSQQVHAGMLQTESPYYQPMPRPPSPFGALTAKFGGDPTFSKCSSSPGTVGCDSSWAIRIEKSSELFFAGAGLYSWFNTYDETCVDARTCQKSLVQLVGNGINIVFLNLITIGSRYMVSSEKGDIGAAENQANVAHPKWSHIGLFRAAESNISTVYIDPIVWQEAAPVVECSPPCVLVLPPSVLLSPTTIAVPPLVTSLEVGWLSNGVFTATTVITTLYIAPVVTQTIEFSNVPVDASVSTFVPVASIMPAPFVITETYPPTVTNKPQTRTIVPPPLSLHPSSTAWVSYVYQSSYISVQYGETVTKVTNGCTFVFEPTAVFIGGSTSITTSLTQPTSCGNVTIAPPLPFITAKPTSTISFITSDVIKPTFTRINGQNEPVIPCDAWFWFFCVKGRDGIGALILFGYRPGVHPPGPPPLPPRPNIGPLIDWPPKIVWPEITIGWNNIPTYRSMEEDEEPACETTTAKICKTTVSRAPTTTSTVSECSTAIGCDVRASSTATTTSVCKLRPGATPGSMVGLNQGGSRAQKTKDDCGAKWAVLHPDLDTMRDVGLLNDIRRAIEELKLPGIVYESKSENSRNPIKTLFWAFERITDEQIEALKTNLRIFTHIDIYRPIGSTAWKAQNPPPRAGSSTQRFQSEEAREDLSDGQDELIYLNHSLSSRQEDTERMTLRNQLPEMALISTPPKKVGDQDFPKIKDDESGSYHSYGAQGKDQRIYLLEYGYRVDDRENPSSQMKWFPTGPIEVSAPGDNLLGHGSCVASKIIGKTVGLAKRANVKASVVNEVNIWESWLDGLLKIYDDILKENSASTSIVNISILLKRRLSYVPRTNTSPLNNGFVVEDPWVDKFSVLIQELLALGVPVVVGAGNDKGVLAPGYPAAFGVPSDIWRVGARGRLDDLIVVGGRKSDGTWRGSRLNYDGTREPGNVVSSNGPIGVDVYAPSYDIRCASGNAGSFDPLRTTGGSSFAAPQVAALIAYWRSLNPGNTWTPRQLKDIVTRRLVRPVKDDNRQFDPRPNPLTPNNPVSPRTPFPPVNLIWNGIDEQCGIWPTDPFDPNIRQRFLGSSARGLVARALPERCAAYEPRIPGSNAGSGIDDSIFAKTMTFSSGQPSPTCKSNTCGKLCDAESPFCDGSTSSNGDFWSPLNPSDHANAWRPPAVSSRSTSSSEAKPSSTPPPPSTPPGPAKSIPLNPTNGSPFAINFWREVTPDTAKNKIPLYLYATDGVDPKYDAPSCNLDGSYITIMEAPTLPGFSFVGLPFGGLQCTFWSNYNWIRASQDERTGTLVCVDKKSGSAYADAQCVKHVIARSCPVPLSRERRHLEIMMRCAWDYSQLPRSQPSVSRSTAGKPYATQPGRVDKAHR